MKKSFYIGVLILFIFNLAGCQKQLMDKPADDGNYHYQNKDLGFNITLPPEFIYYQTQRTQHSGYYDLEFFVPTNDTDYPQEVPSYAKPVVVRIYYSEDWEAIHDRQTDPETYLSQGQKKDRVYMIRFWQEIPDDWTDRWSEEKKQFILSNFKIR